MGLTILPPETQSFAGLHDNFKQAMEHLTWLREAKKAAVAKGDEEGVKAVDEGMQKVFARLLPPDVTNDTPSVADPYAEARMPSGEVPSLDTTDEARAKRGFGRSAYLNDSDHPQIPEDNRRIYPPGHQEPRPARGPEDMTTTGYPLTLEDMTTTGYPLTLEDMLDPDNMPPLPVVDKNGVTKEEPEDDTAEALVISDLKANDTAAGGGQQHLPVKAEKNVLTNTPVDEDRFFGGGLRKKIGSFFGHDSEEELERFGSALNSFGSGVLTGGQDLGAAIGVGFEKAGNSYWNRQKSQRQAGLDDVRVRNQEELLAMRRSQFEETKRAAALKRLGDIEGLKLMGMKQDANGAWYKDPNHRKPLDFKNPDDITKWLDNRLPELQSLDPKKKADAEAEFKRIAQVMGWKDSSAGLGDLLAQGG